MNGRGCQLPMVRVTRRTRSSSPFFVRGGGPRRRRTRSGTHLLLLACWLLLLTSDPHHPHFHRAGVGGVDGWTPSATTRRLDITTTTTTTTIKTIKTTLRHPLLVLGSTPATSVEGVVHLGEDDGAEWTVTTTTAPPSSHPTTTSPPLPRQQQQQKYRPDWWERVQQLRTYREQHGHTRVSRRSDDGLGAWVHKQRQVRWCLSGYCTASMFLCCKPSLSLTTCFVFSFSFCLATQRRHRLSPAQINVLDQLHFCWNATTTTTTSTPHRPSSTTLDGSIHNDNHSDDDAWWEHFRILKQHFSSASELVLSPSSTSSSSSSSSSTKWLRLQRRKVGSGSLLPAHREALIQWDRRWDATPRELLWDARFQELSDYKATYGDCCVPISYRGSTTSSSSTKGSSSSSSPLAQWVSNQRKQYNLRKRGLPSALTLERYHRLSQLGFVWSMDQRVSDRWRVASADSKSSSSWSPREERWQTVRGNPYSP